MIRGSVAIGCAATVAVGTHANVAPRIALARIWCTFIEPPHRQQPRDVPRPSAGTDPLKRIAWDGPVRTRRFPPSANAAGQPTHRSRTQKRSKWPSSRRPPVAFEPMRGSFRSSATTCRTGEVREARVLWSASLYRR